MSLICFVFWVHLASQTIEVTIYICKFQKVVANVLGRVTHRHISGNRGVRAPYRPPLYDPPSKHRGDYLGIGRVDFEE